MAPEHTLIAESIRSYARHKKVSDTTIHKARKSGVLTERCFTTNPKNGRPMIYRELADLDWAANYNPNYTRVTKAVLEDTGQTATNHQVITGKANPLTGARSLAEIKRLQGEIDLQVKALDLKKKKGELVNKAEVYAELFEFGKTIRTAFQVLPDRVTDDLMATKDREVFHTILSGAITEVLEKLSTYSQEVTT